MLLLQTDPSMAILQPLELTPPMPRSITVQILPSLVSVFTDLRCLVFSVLVQAPVDGTKPMVEI